MTATVICPSRFAKVRGWKYKQVAVKAPCLGFPPDQRQPENISLQKVRSQKGIRFVFVLVRVFVFFLVNQKTKYFTRLDHRGGFNLSGLLRSSFERFSPLKNLAYWIKIMQLDLKLKFSAAVLHAAQIRPKVRSFFWSDPKVFNFQFSERPQ